MAEKHFYEQVEYTKKYLLPYFQKNIPLFHKMKVLEIGCAEGGLLQILHEIGMDATGVEIDAGRAKIATQKNAKLKVVVGDIMDESLPSRIGETFDLVIMREVIEHILNKSAAFHNLSLLTKPDGYLFISFPPKRSPFAGHQQIARSPLKIIPYLHILPKSVLKHVAKFLGERDDYVDEIKLHHSTGMIIHEFEFLCHLKHFVTIKRDLFLFRPIYAFRFGLPTIKLPNIPVLREYISFGYETLLKKEDNC